MKKGVEGEGEGGGVGKYGQLLCVLVGVMWGYDEGFSYNCRSLGGFEKKAEV